MLHILPSLMSAASTDVGKYVRRKRRNLIGYCVAILFAITAYFAGVMALVTWLMQSNNPLMSWIVVGIIAISLSLLVIASISIISYFEKQKSKNASAATYAAASLAATQVTKSKTLMPILLSLAGAYFAYLQVSKSRED